jgi:hypothetical protein
MVLNAETSINIKEDKLMDCDGKPFAVILFIFLITYFAYSFAGPHYENISWNNIPLALISLMILTITSLIWFSILSLCCGFLSGNGKNNKKTL